MSSCDLCNKDVDERSLQVRELGSVTIFLCLSCDGSYTDEDLKDKVDSGEIEITS